MLKRWETPQFDSPLRPARRAARTTPHPCPARSPLRRHRRGRCPALAQPRGGHVGCRGAAPCPLSGRPRHHHKLRCRPPPAALRGAAGKGRGSGGLGGPGTRRPAPSRPSGDGAGAAAAGAGAEGAAVGRAAGAVRRAGAGAALLRRLPPVLDVRRHPRPRRAAAGRAERLLRVQPRLRRHRRDADGRAAGAGAALPAGRREVAPGRRARPPRLRTDLLRDEEGRGLAPGTARTRIKP